MLSLETLMTAKKLVVMENNAFANQIKAASWGSVSVCEPSVHQSKDQNKVLIMRTLFS